MLHQQSRRSLRSWHECFSWLQLGVKERSLSNADMDCFNGKAFLSQLNLNGRSDILFYTKYLILYGTNAEVDIEVPTKEVRLYLQPSTGLIKQT